MSAYRLDRSDAKLMGVCSGFASWAGVDVTVVRVGLVLLTLFALGPVAILAYLLTGWIAN